MIWAVIEKDIIWKISENKEELEEFLRQFPPDERGKKKIVLLSEKK
jgi:hypothetical protein